MKNYNFNIPLPSIKKPNFRRFFASPLLRAVVVSLVTVLVTLGILAYAAWHYRAQIFKTLASGYVAQVVASNTTSATPDAKVADALSSVLPPQAPEENVVDAVKKAKPAVVSIVISKEVPQYTVSYQQNDPSADPFGGMFPGISFQTPVYTPSGTKEQEVGSGSGFLISSDGLIVTNRHVVEDKDATYTVLLNNGTKYTATVLARDSVLDVALIKITATGLPYLQLDDSDTLQVGQSVIAIGNALGQFNNTVSAGVVSGLSRSITAGDTSGQSEVLDKVIQTDAAINPGNSGGPLLDLAGNVIGIDVAVVQGSSNIGFALPINSVKSAITSVEKTGKIIRPYIGLRYADITPDLVSQDNLSVDHGILVEPGSGTNEPAVIAGSPADKAGIVSGDIILSVDGQTIDDDHDFSQLIRGKNIGDTVKLVVLSKGGTQRTVNVTLAQAPDNS